MLGPPFVGFRRVARQPSLGGRHTRRFLWLFRGCDVRGSTVNSRGGTLNLQSYVVNDKSPGCQFAGWSTSESARRFHRSVSMDSASFGVTREAMPGMRYRFHFRGLTLTR